MRQILVLGAGQSSPYLIHTLLEMARQHNWFVTIGDIDLDTAQQRLGDHPRGSAIYFDVHDTALRSSQVEHADVVVNMLAPAFQDLIASECIRHGRHMLSVSYRSQATRNMHADAQRKGVLLLCEMGLDPGIDHMSAMALIERIRGEGGVIRGFRSYGSGIPSPDQAQNPFQYLITWNPRNVVMAGEHGAQYMERGRIKLVPYNQVFHHTWPVEVEGFGTLEAYPNRDSLSYMKSFGLDDVETMIRGTLRYSGWSETWAEIVRLGLPNETLRIPDLHAHTYREVIEMFLPLNLEGESPIERRVARFLGISPTGRIMQNMQWLGLFSKEKIRCEGDTAAAMLVALLQEKLPLTDGVTDAVILVHEVDVEYPQSDRPAEEITSTMIVKGEPGRFTAMAKTVGLPAALAVELLLTKRLPLTGSQIPTHPSIYEPVLRGLSQQQIRFSEKSAPL